LFFNHSILDRTYTTYWTYLCQIFSITTPIGNQNQKLLYHRIKTPPQVAPPPNEAIRTMSPSFTLPASTHSSSAIGIEAEDVLPWTAIFE
jgi:hypothetical protein